MPVLSTAMILALMLLLTVLAVVAGALYGLVYGPRARLRRRILQVSGPSQKAKASGPTRRKTLQSKLKDLESARAKRRGWKLREQLAQTGQAWDVRQYVIGSLAAAAVAGGLALILHLAPLAVLFFVLIGGLGLPRMVVKILIGRRVKKFTTHFADAIDVIVRGIRSGLPVGECFNMIASEAPDPVGSEFRQIVEGQRMGLTPEEALGRAVERMPTAELRFFAIVLAIQQTTGGNLAETLAKLSEVLRGRKRMRDKIQAMSSEAKASAGIIGSLPLAVGGLLTLVAPKYIGILFTTGPGHLVLFAGACVMGTGILVMRQMINFDI